MQTGLHGHAALWMLAACRSLKRRQRQRELAAFRGGLDAPVHVAAKMPTLNVIAASISRYDVARLTPYNMCTAEPRVSCIACAGNVLPKLPAGVLSSATLSSNSDLHHGNRMVRIFGCA